MWTSLPLALLTSGFSAVSVDGFGKLNTLRFVGLKKSNLLPFLLMVWVGAKTPHNVGPTDSSALAAL